MVPVCNFLPISALTFIKLFQRNQRGLNYFEKEPWATEAYSICLVKKIIFIYIYIYLYEEQEKRREGENECLKVKLDLIS